MYVEQKQIINKSYLVIEIVDRFSFLLYNPLNLSKFFNFLSSRKDYTWPIYQYDGISGISCFSDFPA